MTRPVATETRHCQHCGMPYHTTVSSRRRFCGRECQLAHVRTQPGVTHFRLPPELAARLKAEAEARDVSMAWLGSRLLVEGLARLVPVDDMWLTRDP